MKHGKIKCPKCKNGIMIKKESVTDHGFIKVQIVEHVCNKCEHRYGRTK